ncbi:putative MFS-type transporter [Rhodotorula toruloides]|nr:putative MFS-type transporter [Rhodotorula toruloides]
MGCWIAESTHTRETHVPGTSLLDDLKASPATQEQSTHLKRDKNGIVLVPQPSDDPRDPLNWPTWKRELAYWNIVFATSLVGAIGPLIAPGFVQIAKEFQVSVNKVAGTNAALVLAIGAAMIPVSTVAIKWGRRPVYIWGAAFLLAGSIWSAAKPDLDNLLASRVIQGLGMAPVESTATATIGDLFPVHQRGMRVAIWGLSLLGGINLAPIVAGTIISTIGWQYCFWTIVPFFALSLIFMVLFLPETAYDRAPIPNSLSTSTGDIVASEDEKDEKAFSERVEDVNAVEKQDSYLPAKSVWQEMLPWSGYVNKDPIWKIFLRPFLMLFSPATFWCFLTYGIASLLLVLVSATNSLIFSKSYGFTSRQTGLVSISPLIASILMSLVAGYVADFLATFMARRNKGVFEPEMRLLLMIPYAVLVVAGYVGWAVSYRNHDHWMVPVIMYGFVNAGQKFLSTASVTYIIDVHREQTSEVQACVNFLKNVISYRIGTEINGWVLGLGIEQTFYVLAGISAGIALTTIPMYHYGKRCRAWVSRNQKLFAL